MKSHGFALVWALILSAILGLIAASLIQAAGIGSRSARGITQGAIIAVEQGNLFAYEQRLLEANSGMLLRGLDALSQGGEVLASRLQAQADQWCDRDPDGRGAGRVRVYFTSRACGQALPSGLSIAPLRLNDSVMEAPFVLQAGRQIRRGTFRAQYGDAPASVYALLSQDDLSLGSNVQIDGDAHTDGYLSISGPVVSGVLSSSNCAAVSPGCAGERRVSIGGVTRSAMDLLPSPARPSEMKGILSLGQSGETAGLFLPTLNGLTTSATRVVLGVLSSGEQSVRICTGSLCTDYIAPQSGDLTLSNGDVVIPGWTGVIGLSGSAVTVTPRVADDPSVVRPLSIISDEPVTIEGSLTYAQTSCAADVCNATGAQQFLSVQAPRITVRRETVRIHGVMISPQFVWSAPLTVFGSVIGTPRGNDLLKIQEDPRSQDGQAAPGVPRLRAQWRQAEVTVQP